MTIPRLLSKELEESPKSLLLLGPRQTGKSTLIRSLRPDLAINLADEAEFLSFARNPNELTQRLAAGSYRTVLIDEVQRLPGILNTIQCILDEAPSRYKFYLTGSSARKLRRGNANLLPGRIFSYRLGPLVCSELNYRMCLREALETGTLPGIYSEENRKFRIKTLRSYSSTYLKEEIQSEALTKNIEGFSRFLFLAANWSGHFLDVAKLSSAAQVTRKAANRFFEILEDTLVVNRCPSFSKVERKRLVKHPKFYFFDTGVLNALLSNFTVSSDRTGLIFEHLIFNQLVNGGYARDIDMNLSTFRTSHGAEVDFIVEKENELFAVEVKHSRNIGRSDLKGLQRFSKAYAKPHRQLLLYAGSQTKAIDGVAIYPWQMGLKAMGL